MTVTWGSNTTVDAIGDQPLAACQLTSTLSMVVYDRSNLKARTINIAEPPTINAEVNIGGGGNDIISLVRVTATSAMLLYRAAQVSVRMLTVSGTTITVNALTALSDPWSERYDLSPMDSTNVLCAWSDGVNAINAVVLSISGTTITEETPFKELSTDQGFITTCVAFSATKGLVTWDASGGDHKGMIIDISGTTITTNTAKSISSEGGPAAGAGDTNQVMQLKMSSTKSVYMFADADSPTTYFAYVLTLNGTTFDVGPQATLTSAGPNFFGRISAASLSSTSLIIAVKTNGTTYTAEGFNITGGSSDVLTSTGTDTKTVTTSDWIWCAEVDSNNILTHFEESSTDIALVNFATSLSLAPMTKPADIDAAGEFIYLALLEGGAPIITKIATDLLSDGSTVFNPGSGDNIGVECGRFNSDVVWVAGQFDGTNVIEYSDDGGSTFSVVDDGTIGGIKSFVMGPDSDNRLLVFDEDNGDILETKDGGATWETVNGSVTPEIAAIARLGQNVEESVFGNDGGASNSVNYSVNSGDDLEDYQTGVYPNANATRVIVN